MGHVADAKSGGYHPNVNARDRNRRSPLTHKTPNIRSRITETGPEFGFGGKRRGVRVLGLCGQFMAACKEYRDLIDSSSAGNVGH